MSCGASDDVADDQSSATATIDESVATEPPVTEPSVATDDLDLSGRSFRFSDPALPDNDVFVRFDGSVLRWQAGCNGHEGRYEVVNGSLDYQFETSDEGECVETQAYEVFDDLLRESPVASIDDGRLVLTGADIELAGEPNDG